MSGFGYEYGSPSSIALDYNLSFREVVYDVVALYFDTSHQSSHGHDFADEQPNLDARAFYDLPRQEDQTL